MSTYRAFLIEGTATVDEFSESFVVGVRWDAEQATALGREWVEQQRAHFEGKGTSRTVSFTVTKISIPGLPPETLQQLADAQEELLRTLSILRGKVD